MSKKNLARTVIEGGRHNYNKWERRNSHAELRARDKSYIAEVKADLENWYDYDVEPLQPVYQGFTDKLGPMYRWLSSQCGRPWNEVRSEISQTFDGRTTAGRHILFDHLLKSVEVTPDIRYSWRRKPEDETTSYYRHDFYVDAEGILREKTVIRSPYKPEKVPYFNTHSIANWLGGRVVGYNGKKLFWFVPADKTKKWGGHARQWMTQWGTYRDWTTSYNYRTGLRYLYLHDEPIYKKDEKGNVLLNESGKHIIVDYNTTWRDGRPQFRQDRRLNDKELAFWNSMPEYYQTKVLEHSPNYVEPENTKRYPYYY